MPKPKKDDGPRKRNGGDKDYRPRKEPPVHRNPDADPVKIHREYVERRLGGGAPATSEAYARAVKQWHELPGAVRRPQTELSASEVADQPPNKGDKGDQGDSAS